MKCKGGLQQKSFFEVQVMLPIFRLIRKKRKKHHTQLFQTVLANPANPHKKWRFKTVYSHLAIKVSNILPTTYPPENKKKCHRNSPFALVWTLQNSGIFPVKPDLGGASRRRLLPLLPLGNFTGPTRGCSKNSQLQILLNVPNVPMVFRKLL